MKEILDHLFSSAHYCFRNKSKTFRNNFAFYYMLLFQLLLLLLLGLFFNAFSRQLNINTLSNNQYVFITISCLIIVLFRSWMVYTGKRRLLILSKTKQKFTPFGIFKLSCIILLLLILIFTLT
jgi:magnesium-transporting ATPase (P-type)